MKDKLIDIAVATWVVIIPMVEMYFIYESTGIVIAELIYCFILCVLIGVHYSILWFSFWVYEKAKRF